MPRNCVSSFDSSPLPPAPTRPDPQQPSSHARCYRLRYGAPACTDSTAFRYPTHLTPSRIHLISRGPSRHPSLSSQTPSSPPLFPSLPAPPARRCHRRLFALLLRQQPTLPRGRRRCYARPTSSAKTSEPFHFASTVGHSKHHARDLMKIRQDGTFQVIIARYTLKDGVQQLLTAVSDVLCPFINPLLPAAQQLPDTALGDITSTHTKRGRAVLPARRRPGPLTLSSSARQFRSDHQQGGRQELVAQGITRPTLPSNLPSALGLDSTDARLDELKPAPILIVQGIEALLHHVANVLASIVVPLLEALAQIIADLGSALMDGHVPVAGPVLAQSSSRLLLAHLLLVLAGPAPVPAGSMLNRERGHITTSPPPNRLPATPSSPWLRKMGKRPRSTGALLTQRSKGSHVYDANGTRDGKKRWCKKTEHAVLDQEPDLPRASTSELARALRTVRAATAEKRASSGQDGYGSDAGSDAGSDEEEDVRFVARSSIVAGADLALGLLNDASDIPMRRVHPTKSRFHRWHSQAADLFDVVYDPAFNPIEQESPVIGDVPEHISCTCVPKQAGGPTVELTVYGVGRPSKVKATCCRAHLVEQITLIDLSGLGANNMAMILESFIRRGTAFQKSRRSYDASDALRKQLRSACTWVTVIERYASAMSLCRQPIWVADRPSIEVDDLHLTLDDLANSCPVCFQGFKAAESMKVPGSEQVTQALLDWDNATGTAPDKLSCIANIRAIDSQGAQQPGSPYDITGVMGACCRHDVPLVFCDMRTPGEQHYYAMALIHAIVRALGTKLQHLGFTYDIGCRFDPSTRVARLVENMQADTKISWSVPVFHVYGHTVSCKTKYSPRNLVGFGFTDGEGMERVWSGLHNLIGTQRNMSEGERRFSLEERLDYLAAARRLDLFKTFASKEKQMQATEREAKEALAFESATARIPLQFRLSVLVASSSARVWPQELDGFKNHLLESLARMSEARKTALDEIAERRRQAKKNPLDAVTVFAEDLLRILGETQELQADMYDRPNTVNNGYKATVRLQLALKAEKAGARKAMEALNRALADKSSRDGRGDPTILTWDTLFDDETFELVEGWAHEGYSDVTEPAMWWHTPALKNMVTSFNTLSRIAEERKRVRFEREGAASWIAGHIKELKARASQHVVYEDALEDMERLLRHWNGDGNHSWALLPPGINVKSVDDAEPQDEEVDDLNGMIVKLATHE
ncbi:hypothetical protein V8E36_001467 [Tilletia maclaganii]